MTKRQWYGHDVPEESHPERPWWKRHLYVQFRGAPPMNGWKHPGGHVAYGDDAEESMAEFDRKRPIPQPDIRVGQVWVAIEDSTLPEGTTCLITRTDPTKPGVGFSGQWELADFNTMALVSGPGSPWKYTGE